MAKIDDIRASKLPSNMMQFAARGALQVSAAENIEILVYLALHNKIFGDVARMTLAGWDEKSSSAAASDPNSPPEVLHYMIAPDNIRPRLLPKLLENPSVSEAALEKFAISAARESVEILLRSKRVRASAKVLAVLRSNPYLTKPEAQEIAELLAPAKAQTPAVAAPPAPETAAVVVGEPAGEPAVESLPIAGDASEAAPLDDTAEVPDEAVSAYMAEHAAEIEAEKDKPFQAIGGVMDLLGADYFPVSQVGEAPVATPEVKDAPAAAPAAKKDGPPEGKRENTVQKINRLDIKGRIQLALKGNKEERALLIRDGTKVVALAVLEAPKLSDGEVEKFASQKNILESVLRAIPLKRRFMKNYIVVRNMVANPRTPLDLGLGLMKNILINDLKNISNNKEISETIRKMALKMYKQKLDAANKK